MDALPDWPEATVAVLTTGRCHQIPVSLARRAGEREIVIGLAPTRASLANLRDDPRCAVTVVAAGLAFTAYGVATIEDADAIVAARIAVDTITDHGQDTFEIMSGVSWRWTDDDAERRDAGAREALRRLAHDG